ncbi:MAG: hypothetical protein ACTHLZ_01540 [Tepidisphaeraceae bacterium]
MLKPAVVVALLMLGGGSLAQTTQPQQDPVDLLIHQLGDPEPRVREDAMGQLSALGDAVRPQLRQAAQSKSPAVADAARALLMDTRWSRMTDPREVRAALGRYGTLAPDQRADILRSLLQTQGVKARPAVLRVLQQDPSDSVAWQALEGIPAGDAWLEAFKGTDPKSFSPGLENFYARVLFAANQGDHAIPLLRHMLNEEADRPSASAHHLLWAVRIVAATDEKDGHPESAIQLWRTLLSRADDQLTSQSELLNQIYGIQARNGPLPGLADDLSAAGKDLDGRAGLMLGILAQRVDAPLAHDLLMEAALSDRPNENDIDRAVRLFEAGNYLLAAGQPESAQDALTRVTLIDAPAARGYVLNAYLRLSDLFQQTGDWQMAGDSLRRALDRLEPQQSLTLQNGAGNIEVLTKENAAARVYWLYYKAADARHDIAEMQKQAKLVMASGSTDGNYFLDVLPTLEKAVEPDAVDAFFDRVYQQQKSQLDASPQNPIKLNDLAWLCGRSNRKLAEANAYAQRALELKPNEPAYLDTYAEIRFRSGAISEAIALETKAAALDPKEPFMREQLARFRQAAATQPGK